MKIRKTSLIFYISFLIFSEFVFAQRNDYFNLTDYQDFLASNQNLSAEDLRNTYPAGIFKQEATAQFYNALYGDSIDHLYQLTDYEKDLIEKHGFMVTERLSRSSYGEALLEIYRNDLPVFVSTDAILHALHMSYDNILKELEFQFIIPNLEKMLEILHLDLKGYIDKFTADEKMNKSLADLDVYITVACMLLGQETVPLIQENNKTVQELIDLIYKENPAPYPLFAENPRTIDFSQFTPRGHYTDSIILERYFRTMIWLGRTEFYLIAPESDDLMKPSKEDVQRQTIAAALLSEMTVFSNALGIYQDIDGLLRFLVGESDNVTIENIQSLMHNMGIQSASALVDTQLFKDFQNQLREAGYAFQKINSQILMSDPMNPDQIQPASAFLMFGQRFVIDSYVCGSVVYDRIKFNEQKVLRMLPSSLDPLFALGNNAAAQLLDPELKKYHYAPNLAALRYLIDSYNKSFWCSSLYNSWLSCIRALNPPQSKSQLPEFMQTAAWWQEKMNTQLTGWAQLRHDNLLYAKQSYTGGATCSYPFSFVEPLPEFYEAVGNYAKTAYMEFQNINFELSHFKDSILEFFQGMSQICDTLKTIAEKELRQEPPNSSEKLFLQKMLFEKANGCDIEYRGWYSRLYYTRREGLNKKDYIIADIHTTPTDEFGAPVGWIYHIGTGPLNLAVVLTKRSDGETIATIGPVSSYYEHISTNFKRLTDEEWEFLYESEPSFRPNWVNLYLADSDGESKGETVSLYTETGSTGYPTIPNPITPDLFQLSQNYPNPFNAGTIITFKVPEGYENRTVNLTVYNVQGQIIKNLINDRIPRGSYITRWDGKTDSGVDVASGVYFYELKIDNSQQIKKMILAR